MCRLISLPLIVGVAVLLAGCVQTQVDAPAAPGGPEDPARQLRVGMTPGQVRDLMGDPLEVRHYDGDDIPVEIWIYRRPLGARVRSIAPTTVEVPWVDPITGQMRSVTDPVPAEERIEVTEELSLDLTNGRLADVRRAVKHDRQISP